MTSNHETPEEIRANLVESTEPGKDDPTKTPEEVEAQRTSEAASKLGKKGAEAAAEKREAAKAEEAEKAKAEAKKGNPKHDPSARVREAVEEAKRAKEALESERRARESDRREREALEARVRAIESGEVKAKPANGEAKAEFDIPDDPRDPKPKISDFDDTEKYFDSLAEWHVRKDNVRRQVMAQGHAVAKNFADKHQAWNEGANAIVSENPDEKDRLLEAMALYQSSPNVRRLLGQKVAPDAPYTANHVVSDLLLNAGKQGPSLALYLLDHPDEREALEKLPSTPVIEHEFAKLVGRLSDAKTDTSRQVETVSKASAPLKSVKGSPPPAAQEEGNESFEQMARKRGLIPGRRRSA